MGKSQPIVYKVEAQAQNCVHSVDSDLAKGELQNLGNYSPQ